MVNKKIKVKKEKEEVNKASIIAFIMVSIFIIEVLISLFIPNSDYILPHNTPQQTVYFPSNQFPIKIYGAYMNGTEGIVAEYIFYGTPQSNGKECISSVAVYPINPTNMQISSKTPLINTTNPEKVVEIYNYSRVYLYFKPYTSDGHTLLCPDVINATK